MKHLALVSRVHRLPGRAMSFQEKMVLVDATGRMLEVAFGVTDLLDVLGKLPSN